MGNTTTKQEFRQPPATPVAPNLLDPRSPRMNRTPVQDLAPETPITTNSNSETEPKILDPRSPSIKRTPLPEEPVVSPQVSEPQVENSTTTQPTQAELLEEVDLASSFKRRLTFTPSKGSPIQTQTMGLDKENVPNESDWLVPKYHRRLRHHKKRQSVSPTVKPSNQGRSPLSAQRLSSPVTQNSPTMKLRNL